ncbi:MAG: hypothetical protein AAF601_02445 [Pseudomonadota bacterium]
MTVSDANWAGGRMRQIALGIGQRAILVIGLGALLVSVSEFWFYEVAAEVDRIVILLAYGLLGYFFMAVMHRFHVHSFAGLVIAAALLGILIEGVPVAVVYSNPPFSIVWTSLAWHALITVGVGWLLVRFLLAQDQAWRAGALCSGLGILLGAWNAFMWNAQDIEGTDAFVFIWQPTQVFAVQFLYGYALFVGGHVVLDRLYPKKLVPTRIEHLSIWILAGAIAVLVAYDAGLLALFPILPGLLLVCLSALRRDGQTHGRSTGTIIDVLYKTRVQTSRFALTLAIPAFAIPTYAVLVAMEAEIEMNAYLILTAGPASVAAVLWSFLRIAMRSKGAAC